MLSVEEWRYMFQHPRLLFDYFAFRHDDGRLFVPYEGQVDITRAILGPDPTVVIRAGTRYGKSDIVGKDIGITAYCDPGCRINIVAPTAKATEIIMGYTIRALLSSPVLRKIMPDTRPKGIERLTEKATKEEVILKNRTTIQAITANILQEGRTAVGQGGKYLFIDEVEWIPSDLVKQKLLRMLGDDKTGEGNLILISNPIRLAYMFEVWKSGKCNDVWIDSDRALAEGAYSRSFIDRMKDPDVGLGPDEFRVWFDACWNEDATNRLIPEAALMAAVKGYEEKQEEMEDMYERDEIKIVSKRLGVDVATRGADKAVLMDVVLFDNGDWWVDDINTKKFTNEDIDETEELAAEIVGRDREHDYNVLGIDATGNGEGVVAAAKMIRRSIAIKIDAVVSASAAEGEAVHDIPNRQIYKNRKAYDWFKVRRLFEKGKIFIPKNPGLIKDLRSITYEFHPDDGRKIIIDPDSKKSKAKPGELKESNKSPDFGDALRYAVGATAPGDFETATGKRF